MQTDLSIYNSLRPSFIEGVHAVKFNALSAVISRYRDYARSSEQIKAYSGDSLLMRDIASLLDEAPRPITREYQDFTPFLLLLMLSEEFHAVHYVERLVTWYSFDGSVRPKARSSFMDLSIEQHREALSAAFGDRPIKGFENVLQALMASYEAIGFKRGRSVMIKLLQYLTENLKLIVKRDKLFYYDVTPTEALLFDEECEEAEGEK